jgi:hypothetical protein
MGSKPATRIEALLDELCVSHGYCLPPDAWAALVADPPEDVDAFVDAVVVAEGLDPILLDKRARRDLTEVVRKWLGGQKTSSVGNAESPSRHA